MSNLLSFYPKLTDMQISKIGYLVDRPSVFYKQGESLIPLELETSSENLKNIVGKLVDHTCVWDADDHDFVFRKNIGFKHVSQLFGNDGVASETSTLGIALNWISTKSDSRGVVCVGDFTADSEEVSFLENASFKKGTLKGSLKVQTVLYLKSIGENEDKMSHFAKQPGTILGVLDETEIFIDGIGSFFPIVTVNEPGKPLWHVEFDDTCEPLEDGFDEDHVLICINRAHPSYESVGIEGPLGSTPLAIEILSSALYVIIQSAKERIGTDWENVLNGKDFEKGSIAAAMNYFMVKLEFDDSSPSTLSDSIRAFFDGKISRGAR